METDGRDDDASSAMHAIIYTKNRESKSIARDESSHDAMTGV